jgi:hypothetical protein
MISVGNIEPPPCPECGELMTEIQPKPVKWRCEKDGWIARLEQGFIAKQVISKRERYEFEAGEVGTSFKHKPIRTNPHLRYLFYKLLPAGAS